MHHLRTGPLPIWAIGIAISLAELVAGCSAAEGDKVPTPASAIDAYQRTANGQVIAGAAGATSKGGANAGSVPAAATGVAPSSSELSGPVALTLRADAGAPPASTPSAPTASTDPGAPPPGSNDDESDDESDDD